MAMLGGRGVGPPPAAAPPQPTERSVRTTIQAVAKILRILLEATSFSHHSAFLRANCDPVWLATSSHDWSATLLQSCCPCVARDAYTISSKRLEWAIRSVKDKEFPARPT